MNCTILTAEALSRDAVALRTIARHLTRPGSDFSRKLHRWIAAEPATPEDGAIAIVRDEASGEIVGWARTETWLCDTSWNTLEAFVHLGWRKRGIAAFAAPGLVASGWLPEFDDAGRPTFVAVFRPAMMLLARRVGLWPRLFQRDEAGRWVQA